MKTYLTFFLSAMILLSFSSVQAKEWKKIRVGIETSYPPFSFMTKDGQPDGFDIDIAKALVKEIGAEIVFVNQDWDGIIPALMARKYDCIIASMGITEERKKKVAFSTKYYYSPSVFVGKKGKFINFSQDTLNGKKIGVQRATAHDTYLSKNYNGVVEIKRYGKMDEANIDLINGRIDMMLADKIQLYEGFLKTEQGKNFEFIGPDLHDPIFGEGQGVAIRKIDTDLVDKFNEAIVKIRTNGTYKKINDKYFEFDIFGK